MLEDPAVVRVDELAARHAMSPRTLQRLFRRYVGVSPKWVLQRYRLHEAAERIAEGRDGDWAATALELGYFDQAHFIRDFKALIGASPAQYAGGRSSLGAEDAVARVAQARGGCSRARRAARSTAAQKIGTSGCASRIACEPLGRGDEADEAHAGRRRRA